MVVGRAHRILHHNLVSALGLTSIFIHGIIGFNKSIALIGTFIQRGGGTGPMKPRQPEDLFRC